VSKSALARLEATVTSGASEIAGAGPAARATPAGREALARSLRSAGLDFAQVYARRDGRWQRADHLVAAATILARTPDLADDLDVALEEGVPIRSRQGALAGVARAPDGTVVVAGVSVAPDFFDRIEDVGQGMQYYRRLGVVVPIHARSAVAAVAVVVVVLAALALIVAHALAGQMSRPLRDLSGALRRVAAGDLAVRVRPVGATELRSLGDSFNAMAEGLESARRAAQEAEREAAWRDVARKLAHEFKNILTPMRLSLQVLESEIDALPPERRDTSRRGLEAALGEVAHLDRLAEQFSQYARLPEPRLEPLDLAEVARAVADLEGPTVVAGGDSAPVRGDRLLLTRAVHNLVRNAREAGPAHGPVEVRTAVEGGHAVIEVLDRGPGLPNAVRDRAFEPYVSTKKRGSGLGLSLVRDIARQHGGAATLAARDGGGLRARLTLPHEPGGAPAPAPGAAPGSHGGARR